MADGFAPDGAGKPFVDVELLNCEIVVPNPRNVLGLLHSNYSLRSPCPPCENMRRRCLLPDLVCVHEKNQKLKPLLPQKPQDLTFFFVLLVPLREPLCAIRGKKASKMPATRSALFSRISLQKILCVLCVLVGALTINLAPF